MNHGFQLRQRQVQVKSEFAESVFPRLAHTLYNSESFRNAVDWISKGKPVRARYRSTIDFLFCEYFPRFKRSCFSFYEDPNTHAPLCERVTQEEIEEYQDALLWAVSYARFLMKKGESPTWAAFVGQSKRARQEIWDEVNKLSDTP